MNSRLRFQWATNLGETLIDGIPSRGVIDIHSSAPGKGSEGIHYRDY